MTPPHGNEVGARVGDADDTATSANRLRGMKAFASLTILVALGMQTLAIIGPLAGASAKRSGYLWPFLDYPMYKRAHRPGDLAPEFHVVGLCADGDEVKLTAKDLGLNRWEVMWRLVPAVRQQDAEKLRTYLASYEREQGRPLIGVRVENRQVRFHGAGFQPAPTKVVGVVRFDTPREESE